MTEPQYRDRPYSRVLGALRLLALWAIVIVILLAARPSVTSVLVGALVVAVGEAIRVWAAGHLVKTTELVISGPYRYTRNPLYLGRLLIFTGLCIMATLPFGLNWVLLALGWVVFFGYYLRRKEKVEPARLERFHGEAYRRYFEAVPALLPKLRPYPGAGGAGWRLAKMLRNREQWMVLLLSLVVLFLFSRARGGGP